MLGIVGYIATAFSFAGIILNAKKKTLCWPVWIVGATLWLVHYGVLRDIPSLILWGSYVIFDIWGWYSWAKKKK